MIGAAVTIAAACTPLVTCSTAITTNCATPTPVIEWDHNDLTDTVIYRVIWRRVGDVEWRGLYDLAVWKEIHDDDIEVPIYPGITHGVPIQRILPTTEQLVDIELSVMAVDAAGLESVPSESITICMPALCPRYGPCD